jgi:hypothetical protein
VNIDRALFDHPVRISIRIPIRFGAHTIDGTIQISAYFLISHDLIYRDTIFLKNITFLSMKLVLSLVLGASDQFGEPRIIIWMSKGPRAQYQKSTFEIVGQNKIVHGIVCGLVHQNFASLTCGCSIFLIGKKNLLACGWVARLEIEGQKVLSRPSADSFAVSWRQKYQW